MSVTDSSKKREENSKSSTYNVKIENINKMREYLKKQNDANNRRN